MVWLPKRALVTATPRSLRLILDRPSTDEEELRAYWRSLVDVIRPPSAVQRLLLGFSADLDASPEERAGAAERHQRVALALEAVGERSADALHRCFAWDRPPELEVYGLLAGLVVELPEATTEHELSGTTMDLASWLGRLPRRSHEDRGARWLLERLVSQAETQFVGAMLSYRDAKRRLGLGRS